LMRGIQLPSRSLFRAAHIRSSGEHATPVLELLTADFAACESLLEDLDCRGLIRALLACGSRPRQPAHEQHHEGYDGGPEQDHHQAAEQHRTPAPAVPHAVPVDLRGRWHCRQATGYPEGMRRKSSHALPPAPDRPAASPDPEASRRSTSATCWTVAMKLSGLSEIESMPSSTRKAANSG